jgi:SAM-dependent MidA family methyltransferase
MDWALHDPHHGAYGAGRLGIGPRGDFATSPSLGPAFAELLAPQIAEWLLELGEGPLALVETGPGEGDLALQLAQALRDGWPALAQRCSLVLVEPNAGMAERQAKRLAASPLPTRWSDLPSLAAEPVRGVVLAHEVLDALAVQRIVWDGQAWREQRVALSAAGGLTLQAGDPLDGWAAEQLDRLGLSPAPRRPERPRGWCTELHPGLEPWLTGAAAALAAGRLLVVDYAMEAERYYALQRSDGTLMAYRGQRASPDPLQDPGHWDITAHLCLESLDRAARTSGWVPLGACRQGQALLALGLAQALHGLQRPGEGEANLAALLARREALLRLVDPASLGEFRWIAFARGEAGPRPRFLQEPSG